MFLLSLRCASIVTALHPESFSSFLLNGVLKNYIQHISAIFFFTFKTTNFINAEGLHNAHNAVLACMFINLYILTAGSFKMIQSALHPDVAKRHAISLRKLATLSGVEIRHGLQIFFTAVTMCCGMFLFCIMEADVVHENVL